MPRGRTTWLGGLHAGVVFATLLASGCTAQRTPTASRQNPEPTASDANLARPQPSPPGIFFLTEKQLPEVPFVTTPETVVAEMLRMADVKKDDVLYDLGCGDGRIVVTAAREFGTRGVGIDVNPERIKESTERAREAGVSDRVKFVEEDIFAADLREASVVTMYLLPDVNLRLRPKLLSELKPGTRIVSHNYGMGDWKPEKVRQVRSPRGAHTIFYWVVPGERDNE